MKPPIYRYGDTLSSEEALGIIRAVIPKMSRRVRKVPVPRLLDGIQRLMPNRFAHEVNRQRGWAFDSGEAGFSHTVIT